MYAVIQTGGKQYRVAPGDEVSVEKLSGEVGDEVRFDQVLLVRNDDGVQLGQPYVDGTAVTGTVVAQERSRKILVFKFKRRKNYKRLNGHRQHLTRIRVNQITTG
ncbi:MAG: 50S ribosomal protein L21 [Myxococcales bacterium]|nr:50S ribosomal protein L21 [Myxococcales bacterium]|tara:strand:- start:1946 stop:2260 length:315 start_codon:yes stop_codon:yes gene_type:complete